MCLSFQEDKQTKIQQAASRLLTVDRVTCLQLQHFLGLTNFVAIAVPRAWFCSRALQGCLSSAYKSLLDHFRLVTLSEDAIHELRWRQILAQVSKRSSPEGGQCH